MGPVHITDNQITDNEITDSQIIDNQITDRVKLPTIKLPTCIGAVKKLRGKIPPYIMRRLGH